MSLDNLFGKVKATLSDTFEKIRKSREFSGMGIIPQTQTIDDKIYVKTSREQLRKTPRVRLLQRLGYTRRLGMDKDTFKVVENFLEYLRHNPELPEQDIINYLNGAKEIGKLPEGYYIEGLYGVFRVDTAGNVYLTPRRLKS